MGTVMRVGVVSDSPGTHWPYQTLWTSHLSPWAQHVGPSWLRPWHCSHFAAHAELPALAVGELVAGASVGGSVAGAFVTGASVGEPVSGDDPGLH